MAQESQVYPSLTTKSKGMVNYLLREFNNPKYEERNKKEAFYEKVKKVIYIKVKLSKNFWYSKRSQKCKYCVREMSAFCRMMQRREGHKTTTRFLFQRKKDSQLINLQSEIIEEGRKLKIIPRYKSRKVIVISLKVWTPSQTHVITIPNDDEYEENLNFSF